MYEKFKNCDDIRLLATDYCIKNPTDIDLNRLMTKIKLANNKEEVLLLIKEFENGSNEKGGKGCKD